MLAINFGIGSFLIIVAVIARYLAFIVEDENQKNTLKSLAFLLQFIGLILACVSIFVALSTLNY